MWSTENLPLLCFMAHLMSTLLENPLFVTNKTSMLWVKAFHVIFVVCWFAGLFYLPRLYVYHSLTQGKVMSHTFKVMERRLYWGIMTPSAILTLITGLWMLINYAWSIHQYSYWLYLKFLMVGFVFGFHILCGKWLYRFQKDRNTRTDIFYRIVNEVPIIFLAAICILVIVRSEEHTSEL